MTDRGRHRQMAWMADRRSRFVLNLIDRLLWEFDTVELRGFVVVEVDCQRVASFDFHKTAAWFW